MFTFRLRGLPSEVYVINTANSSTTLQELINERRSNYSALAKKAYLGFVIKEDTLVASASDGTELVLHPVRVGGEGPAVWATAHMLDELGMGDNKYFYPRLN
jgi:hypothetical protein